MCNLALKSKDAYKTYEMGHDEDRGFKCIFCRMTEWEVMKNRLKSHKRIKETY